MSMSVQNPGDPNPLHSAIPDDDDGPQVSDPTKPLKAPKGIAEDAAADDDI
ncbi:MAG: hypothetical protein WA071_02190 [Undibacterium umbellatum]|uniref:hypothetical protein n=1 Tax=Undibacterium umbellatum TaxID=2762300 RepID=UPI003BB644C4